MLLTILSSCTKFGRNVTIKGKVINPVTNEPVEGIEAWLQKTKDLQFYGSVENIKEETTDANGRFEFNATRLGKLYLLIGDVKGNYRLGWYENGEYGGTSEKSVKKGEVMNVEYHVVPYGKYQLIVNNVNCQGPNDTIIINQQNEVGSFYNEDWILTGCEGYTTSLGETPMGDIYIDWTVIRGGVSESFSDTVFLNEGEELSYEINY